MPICLERHVAYMRQRRLTENTIYQRGRALTRLRKYLGFNLFDATPDALAEWRVALDRLSDQGIICEVSHVRQFYAWAVLEGLVDYNPAARIPVPRLGRRLPRPIAEDRLMYAVRCAPPRIRPWLVLAGWAGMRAKEIAYLRRTSVLEKAMPPAILIAGDATKGHDERVLPMSGFVLAELVPVLPDSGWVFKRLDGQRGPNAPGLVSRLCNDYLHDCGFAETLHQLRHRFLTGAWHATRDLRVVQELAGHKSPTTTAVYTAYDQADAIKAVEALPAPRHLHVVSE